MLLSIQLYTVRDALAKDVRGTLSALRDIGLRHVELAGDYGLSGAEWRSMLDELGLKASGAHVGLDAFENDLDGAARFLNEIGAPFAIVPWIGADRYANGWASFGKSLESIAEKLKKYNLPLCYHNHDFEFKSTENGMSGLEALYAASDPSLVKAEVDLAWVQIGGTDPASFLKKLAGRLPLVHLKDFDPDANPRWVPAGKGRVDFEPILTTCRDLGVEYGVIELDESPGEPLDAVRESYQFFERHGLS